MGKFPPEKEVELIIKSIEDGSKHCRNVLFTLLVSSFYILLAAFSGHTGPNVELPVIEFTVKSSEFFAGSPLIVLSIYLYLHIYVGDLRGKLAVFQGLNLKLSHATFPGMLLFPWILTFAFSDSKRNQLQKRSGAKFAMPSAYVFLAAILLVWILAPGVLFVLWVKFVGQQKLISLIPCLATIAAMYGSSGARVRSRAVLSLFVSISLLVISVASVPELRSYLPLERVWQTVLAVTKLPERPALPEFALGITAISASIIIMLIFETVERIVSEKTTNQVRAWLLYMGYEKQFVILRQLFRLIGMTTSPIRILGSVIATIVILITVLIWLIT